MNDLLNQAISSIKAGNKSQGRQLLIQVLEQDSKNELAWLWLSQCVSNTEQKLDCLKHVLEINPNSAQAKEEIARIQTLSQIKSQPQAPVQPARTVQSTPPVKKKAKSSKSLAYILVTAIVLGCICIFAISALSGGGGGDTSGGGTAAYLACQNLIEKRLAAPATTKWPSSSEISIATLTGTGKESYRVRGYVDSQNYLGALLRTNYVCDVSYMGNDQWHLENLTFDE